MKGKRAIWNIITNIVVQFTLAISGLVIPRLIMKYYGSEMNGLVSSISQFISYAALIEMGIANASVIALYTPLSEFDNTEISAVVSATRKMYLVTACIYSCIIVGIAGLYPLLYKEQLGYVFVFEMIICIGAVNAVDYFFLGKYKVLLIADQRYYVLNIARIAATLLLLIISVILLMNGISLVVIKSAAVAVHILEALTVFAYVKSCYRGVDFRFYKMKKIAQRWNAMIHQLCATVVYNTDIVVLTLFLPGHSLLEISVYSVYAMVLGLVSNLVGSFTTGISPSFGNMMARGKEDSVRQVFNMYEYVYFIVLFIMYGCFAALVLSFVSCYTKGMDDVNYVRAIVGLLFAMSGLSAQMKDASGVVINAAGKYKETQKFAIQEAIINIAISLILVRPLGIVGVLLGTLLSHIWMGYCSISFMETNLITGTINVTLARILRNVFVLAAIVLIEVNLVSAASSWIQWFLQALVVSLINTTAILGVNFIFEPKVAIKLWEKGMALLRNGKK